MREEGITLAFVGFQKSSVPRERIWEFERELLDEVRSTPGVLDAAMTSMVPLLGGSWTLNVTANGTEGASKFTWVSQGYFGTMDIPVLAGRNFDQRDTAASQRVVIVNQTFVRTFLNGANPIGQTFRSHPEPNYPGAVYQIVGVIRDTKYRTLRDATPPMTLAPLAQFPDPQPFTAMMIRSSGDPGVAINMLKRRMAEKHPEMVAYFGKFQQRIRDGMVRERMMAMLSGFFGSLAALLGMVGLYGVVSYRVGSRRNEIGIRIALGASRTQVIGMVMREAGLLLLIGVMIGTGLALIAARSAESLVFGLKPSDPLTLITAAGLLAVIGAIGGFLPARRASKVDPMAALRCE
jgi:predicted permease